ncbi:MAG: hypothetical protein JWN65_4045 [Solirubrobacterales bacterium]|jgi:hypothetical protein|nr:hypothetical protein [Solirubrobacterales bacterium]
MIKTPGAPLRLWIAAAATVGVLCFVATSWYVAQRPASVDSTAQLVLVPAGTNPDARLQRLQTFSNSGVAGTFVEYLSAIGATVDGGTLTARAVPDSRVIDLRYERSSGARQRLSEILTTALAGQKSIVDDWEARTLRQPSAESPAGPSAPTLMLAGGFLALLAALATFTALRALPRKTPLPPPVTAEDDQQPGVPAPAFGEREEPRLVQRR